MSNCQGFDRRSFFGSLAAAGLGSAAILTAGSTASAADEEASEEKKVVLSFPMLQNVTADGATVSWAIGTQATGWVEWGPTPALGKIARKTTLGLNPLETEFLSARMTGLAPNSTYYYRTATSAFSYKTAYSKTAEEPIYSEIYSFKTTGPSAETVSFATLNDLHNALGTIQAGLARVDEIAPDFLFWNGDVCADTMDAKNPQTTIANPTGKPFAAERPQLFVSGNHEKRGAWARNMTKLYTPWPQDDPEFAELAYNFAFRQGPLAIVGLDTGEDKPDWHPAWSGMASFEPYRELQAAWLEKALSRPEIASAPYLIAFCHIPLYDADPKANPGNILHMYADYQWSCGRMWGPLFEKHGVQLLVAAHQHRFWYAEPNPAEGRSWAQIVGGGPQIENATLIRGEANAEALTLTCEKLEDKSVLGTWKFAPRF